MRGKEETVGHAFALDHDQSRPWARIVVLHDQELTRIGLRFLLGRERWTQRCLTTADVGQARSLCERFEAHLTLVGSSFVERDPGIVRALTGAHGSHAVLVAGPEAHLTSERAQALGALGCVSPGWPAAQIVSVVQGAAGGHVAPAKATSSDLLSERQRQILALAATGATVNQISGQVFLAPDTVKHHLRSIYRKLGVGTRVEAVVRARSMGLMA
ncbi:MAG: hypothetical protein V7607_1671 [Solirubrobacteraceae bacterium]